MYYPRVADNGNSRSMISTWLGYNHNYRINNGEFYDMENLSSDNFPLMTPRAIRPRLAEGDMKGIIITDNHLTYLDKNVLHYGVKEIDLSDILDEDIEWQNLYRFGAYLVMHPACVYVNLYDDTDRGTMRTKVYSGADVDITYTICDAEGNNFDSITASDEAPTGVSTGTRWLKTKAGEEGLYVWNKDSWQPIPTCYIRIDAPGAQFTKEFKVGDVVNMNSDVEDINEGSQIKALTDTSLVVIGVMDSITKKSHTGAQWKFYAERKVPEMDFVCTNKNRMWGCKYGIVGGEMVNEIYCSALGDFKNWYTYQGLASDSYAVTVGVPEQWTGCISYQGYPTFFKENAILRVFGEMPSNFQVNQINARGIQLGSSKSLAVVGEYLVYKSAFDVCVFDGSSPRSISDPLGKTNYYDAVAGGCVDKYYISMQTEVGGQRLFAYDFKLGMWTKESAIKALQFTTTENGQMYAATSTDIYGFGNTENMAYVNKLITEEWVDWYATTGEMGYEYADYKYVNRITLRAYVPSRSELRVSISYDDKPFQDVGIVRGFDEIKTQSLSFNPLRCDHFRIKFEGHGDFIVYTLAITMDTESEEDGY